jgi:hypothetical protein
MRRDLVGRMIATVSGSGRERSVATREAEPAATGGSTDGRSARDAGVRVATFGDVPLNLELKLEVWDSPNSAEIVIDAVLARPALDNGVAGALEGPSSYLMKAPPRQLPDDEAHEAVEEFIRRNARAPGPRAAKPARVASAR